jgi:RES domain-containing protein
LSLNLWRISKRKYATTAFNGEGARRFDGRWNSRGRSVVYTSATLSLAALETFVHMEISEAGNLFVCIRAEIPDEISMETISLSQLPSNWRNLPAPSELSVLGDKWFDEGQTAILVVPSAVIPVENNYLINPLHPDFSKIQIHPPQPFELDPRMWKLS